MTRLQIIVICVVVIVVWMAARSLFRRLRQDPGKAPKVDLDEIDAWYQSARETIALMDWEERARREAEWAALSGEQRAAVSEQFLRDRFGPNAGRGFTRQERLEIGKTSHIASP